MKNNIKYLRTMQKVMELKNFLENGDSRDGGDDGFEGLPRLKVGGDFVGWESFYYNQHQLMPCFLRDNKTPVCIEGLFSLEQKDNLCKLKLRNPANEKMNDKNVKEIPNVEFPIKDKSIKEQLLKVFVEERIKLTVYAVVTCQRSPEHENKNELLQFLNIRGKINSILQIYIHRSKG